MPFNTFLVKKNRITLYYHDHWLLLLIFSLLALGLLLVASASISIANHYHYTSLYFVLRQAIYILLGLGIVQIAKHISLVFWLRRGGYLLMASMLLLILVLVPGVGKTVNGSIRWINFGIVSLQASECMKIVIVIYMAGYLARHLDRVRTNLKEFLIPLALGGAISILLILEPDFGAVVVICFTILGMLYLAGAKLLQFFGLLVIMASSLVFLAIMSPYRLVRLTSFLNPWASPFDQGYQLVQALIAFGRGGLWGVGLGNSVQKLFYLPEAHTDFLFAILAEEFGIIGQLSVIALFTLFILRSCYIGYRAARIKNWFAAYLAYGIALAIGCQALINIGVNLGLLPTKGLALPFMSYGGSSMIFNFLALAILFRIYHEITLQTVFTPKSYFLTTKIIKASPLKASHE